MINRISSSFYPQVLATAQHPAGPKHTRVPPKTHGATYPMPPNPGVGYYAREVLGPCRPRLALVDLDKTATVGAMLFEVPWWRVRTDPTFLATAMRHGLPLAPLAIDELMLGGHPTHVKISRSLSRQLRGINLVNVGRDFAEAADPNRLFNLFPVAMMDDVLGRGGTAEIWSASLRDYALPIGEIMKPLFHHAATPGAQFQVMGTPTQTTRNGEIRAVGFLQHGEGKMVRLAERILRAFDDGILPEEIIFITDSHTDAPVFALLLELGVPPENFFGYNPPNKKKGSYRNALLTGTWNTRIPVRQQGDNYFPEKSLENVYGIERVGHHNLLLIHALSGDTNLKKRRALLLHPAAPLDYRAIFDEARTAVGGDPTRMADLLIRQLLPRYRQQSDAARERHWVDIKGDEQNGYIELGLDFTKADGYTLMILGPDGVTQPIGPGDARAKVEYITTFSPAVRVIEERHGRLGETRARTSLLPDADWQEQAVRPPQKRVRYVTEEKGYSTNAERRSVSHAKRWWAWSRPFAEAATYGVLGTQVRLMTEGEAVTSLEASQMFRGALLVGVLLAAGLKAAEMVQNVRRREYLSNPDNALARWLTLAPMLWGALLIQEVTTGGAISSTTVGLAAAGATTATAVIGAGSIIGGWLIGGLGIKLLKIGRYRYGVTETAETLSRALGPAAVAGCAHYLLGFLS